MNRKQTVDLPKYVKLSADNTSFVPTNFTTTIAETSEYDRRSGAQQWQYFVYCDLLFPLSFRFCRIVLGKFSRDKKPS